MLVKKDFYFSGAFLTGVLDEPEICPRCHRAIKPNELHCKNYKNAKNEDLCAALYLCPSCEEAFAVLYEFNHNFSLYPSEKDYDFRAHPLYVGPACPSKNFSDKNIAILSPHFIEFYNQSAFAEDLGLDGIAGIGYRKALEFLIKDFCIHLTPENEEEIKNEALGKCIATRIQNEQIKTLASRSAWLGNDETHYVRKHDNRDVKDLKVFIEACVYFVGMTLVVEDAASISPL